MKDLQFWLTWWGKVLDIYCQIKQGLFPDASYFTTLAVLMGSGKRQPRPRKEATVSTLKQSNASKPEIEENSQVCLTINSIPVRKE